MILTVHAPFGDFTQKRQETKTAKSFFYFFKTFATFVFFVPLRETSPRER